MFYNHFQITLLLPFDNWVANWMQLSWNSLPVSPLSISFNKLNLIFLTLMGYSALWTLFYYFFPPQVQYCFIYWFLYYTLAFINYTASHHVLQLCDHQDAWGWKFILDISFYSFIFPNCFLPGCLFHKLIFISLAGIFSLLMYML